MWQSSGESPPTVHSCDLHLYPESVRVQRILHSCLCTDQCVCGGVLFMFTVKDAVVCQEVAAILRLSFAVHHPGAHG